MLQGGRVRPEGPKWPQQLLKGLHSWMDSAVREGGWVPSGVSQLGSQGGLLGTEGTRVRGRSLPWGCLGQLAEIQQRQHELPMG